MSLSTAVLNLEGGPPEASEIQPGEKIALEFNYLAHDSPPPPQPPLQIIVFELALLKCYSRLCLKNDFLLQKWGMELEKYFSK